MVEVEPWALRQLVAESPDRLRQKLLTHARYEHIWEQANRGWLRSLKDSVTQKDKSDKDGGSNETITKGQAGDPAFLAQMNGALKGIRELWGLDETDKIDVNLNQRETHIVVIEDPNWYGNRAHELDTAHANATPAIGPALGGEVQGGSLRPTLGQNGAGPNGAH